MPSTGVPHLRLPADLVPRIRRALGRRPWLFWLLVVGVAVVTGAVVHGAVADVEREREAWGTSLTVQIATRDLPPGAPLDGATARRQIPLAAAPDDAATSIAGDVITRQRIGRGEIVVAGDLAEHGAGGLAPPGTRIVAVVEPVPSGAEIGATASVAADGVVLSEGSVVVGVHGDATLVAVADGDAAAVAAAAVESRAALLIAP